MPLETIISNIVYGCLSKYSLTPLPLWNIIKLYKTDEVYGTPHIIKDGQNLILNIQVSIGTRC